MSYLELLSAADRAAGKPLKVLVCAFNKRIAVELEESLAAPRKDLPWSQQQLAIFRHIVEVARHLVVRARAGTSKTTCLIEAVKRLMERHPDAEVEAKTLHSVGFAIVRKFWSGVRMDNGRRKFRLAEEACGEQAPDAIICLVAKLNALGRECEPLARSGRDLVDLAWRHDLVPDPEWEEWDWDLDAVCDAAYRAMKLAKKRPAHGIDFADMLYLPIANGWIRPRYNQVLVDEAQDMNKSQLIMSQRLLLPGGKMSIIGDDRQGIYAFRGADAGALDRLKKELDAEELGLTTTYRCGKRIAELAATIVPDYRADDANPDGVITREAESKLLELVEPGSIVLSRLNAPLISWCLKALRAGLPARVEGKDVAAGIRALAKKLSTGKAKTSVPQFLTRLANYQEREEARAEREIKNDEALERRIGAIDDKCGCLRALADGIAGMGELWARIDALFDPPPNGHVVFSSVHKAKGLEWPKVFVLAGTLRTGRTEEMNIQYVAFTRAAQELVLLGTMPGEESEMDPWALTRAEAEAEAERLGINTAAEDFREAVEDMVGVLSPSEAYDQVLRNAIEDARMGEEGAEEEAPMIPCASCGMSVPQVPEDATWDERQLGRARWPGSHRLCGNCFAEWEAEYNAEKK